ncbi:WD40 repeat domain-containing protein [[Eubacterium] cellulosolvens]
MNFSKFFIKVLRFLSFYFIFVFLILPISTIPISVQVPGDGTESTGYLSIGEEDIISMGVKWTYRRPDNSPEGNSTSWKLRWSPDGKKIAVVYFDNTTVILDGETGDVISAFGASAKTILASPEPETTRGRSQPPEATPRGSRCWGWTTNPGVPVIRACEWSPNGELLAVSGDHQLVEIYNTTTWTRETVFTGHQGSVLSLDWSPDGTRLASGEGTDQVLPHNQDKCQNNIKIWDMATGEELYTLTGHKDSIVSLSWSKNSSRLVSASDDRNLKLWDANNGTLIYTLGEGMGHSAGVLDVYWSPNQTLLVSGSRDFKIRLWDVETGTPIGKPWKDNNCVRSTHWHPAGKYIVTAGVDQTMKIRNATTGKELKVFTEAEETNSEVMSARWSPDGSTIAACSSRDATVRLYAFGIEEPTEEESDWLIGITIFFIIVVVGLILLYLPLRGEFRERRK